MSKIVKPMTLTDPAPREKALRKHLTTLANSAQKYLKCKTLEDRARRSKLLHEAALDVYREAFALYSIHCQALLKKRA
jgi:hypothetical protein